MPVTRRSRSLADPPERVWEVVSDPHHLPRWWPRVERVEGLDDQGFTQVLRSARGKVVRADYAITALEPPRHCRWDQQLVGTPFERILRRSEIEIQLDPDQGGTRVTLTLRQDLAGASRFGGFMVRKAARSQLDEALDGLGRIHG
jgi:uncharacterized protein YndB with AHSA1/START domain